MKPSKNICVGCTTPAILCPSANEPKDKVTKCNSKNARWVAKEPAPKVTLIGDLLHCPFCGSIEISHDGHISVCDICHAQGPDVFPVPDEKKVFELWNRRYPNPPANPAPERTAPKVTDEVKCPSGCGFVREQAASWEKIWDECIALGMETNNKQPDGVEDIFAFIRSLAQRAGESLDIERVLKAVDDEPELPGTMPAIMETYTLENALRAVVRATKRGIRERIKSVTRKGG